jgi:hypothetical protein
MREGGVGWLLGSLCGYAEADEESDVVVRLPAGRAARRARDVAGSCCEAACELGNLGEDPRGGIA